MAVLPESSFVHTVHSGKRTQAEAQTFINQVKERSDGQAPFFESDAWFYQAVLGESYGQKVIPAYAGRGRKPLSKQVADPELKYAQVVKQRENGKVVHISTRIVLGDELEILALLDQSQRCKTISTSLVESRNGAFRKDNKRQARKTKTHSKKMAPHDAMVVLLAAVYNFTKENQAFRQVSNPEAKRFETKFKKVSPAMKEGLLNRILSLEEMLLCRPVAINII